ncbi:hypothetical protein Hanom_Chr06g00551331 [Helianthus anomalus]
MKSLKLCSPPMKSLKLCSPPASSSASSWQSPTPPAWNSSYLSHTQNPLSLQHTLSLSLSDFTVDRSRLPANTGAPASLFYRHHTPPVRVSGVVIRGGERS